jgi:steroid delta-isomerase-like uncharacterized protein
MSDPAEIAKQYFESFNQRDWDKMRSLLHGSYTYTGGDGQVQQGPDAGIAVAQMFAGAMSDARIAIKNIITSGDTAITEFIGSGTQDGDFMGIAPTGRKVTMPVCNVVEIRDGKIYAEREYMDMAHMMQQLGVMPEMATA